MSAYEQITAKILAAIETGAATGNGYRMPWHSAGGRPINVVSGRAYRGINTLVLWSEAQERGYSSALWGTLKQWNEKGARVRKGEKSSLIVFWKDLPAKADEEAEDGRRFVLKTSRAFNLAQVDGCDGPAGEGSPMGPHAPHTHTAAEELAYAARVDFRLEGSRAFYHGLLDYVQIPEPADFHTVEGFQSVLLHECVHWTGHKSRLSREFGKRFGDQAYAFEELVAELGAAFLCADLGVSNEPRPDHAEYVANWLRVLRNDPRAIFTASSAAARASDFLLSFQSAQEKEGIAA